MCIPSLYNNIVEGLLGLALVMRALFEQTIYAAAVPLTHSVFHNVLSGRFRMDGYWAEITLYWIIDAC